jgi:hypothetical protein
MYPYMVTQVNDLLRDAFTNKDKLSGQDKIFFPLEVLAGCGAGASQVVFTVSDSIMYSHMPVYS